MNILVLNGSPRSNGNTKKLVNAFSEGASGKGHMVTVVDVCRKNIHGWLALLYGGEEQSGSYPGMMIIGHIAVEYLAQVAAFPASVQVVVEEA